MSVNRTQGQPPDPIRFAKLLAKIQNHLGRTSSLVGIANLLGPSAKQHFEARDVALARLEHMASKLLTEMEEWRIRREQTFEEKERGLEEKYRKKEDELQSTAIKETTVRQLARNCQVFGVTSCPGSST